MQDEGAKDEAATLWFESLRSSWKRGCRPLLTQLV